MAEEEFTYPAHWEADVVLRDGATAHLRPVRPSDQQALATMFAGQSERTIYLRFFTYKSALTAKELVRFTTVDHTDRVAFVLMHGEEMIGIGRYDRGQDPTEAEVAFFISDAHHGRGIGSVLLEHLAAAARERGITRFSAEVLPENRKMLNVFADAGYELSRVFDDGVVLVHFDIDPTQRSRDVMESREHRAEARSVATLLAPRSVAVLGDCQSPQALAAQLLQAVAENGFTGALHAVDPDALEAAGVPAVPEIAQVPGPVDLAVVAVPVQEVLAAVTACGRAGVRGVLVATSGFADDGARGRRRQREVVRAARTYGMRVIGPASWGLVNTDPEVELVCLPGEVVPRRGSLGLFTQSSALGMMAYAAAAARGLGVSSMISAGNRADLSGNDAMQYWEDDPATTACCLYLESIGNPRKFSRIVRRLARTKPVVVATSDATGVQLPPGHTGRTTSAPPEAMDAMFRQAGVIRARTTEHMMDIAQALEAQPLPAGRRTAVLSNAFALAQAVADACRTHGMEVSRTLPTLGATAAKASAGEHTAGETIPGAGQAGGAAAVREAFRREVLAALEAEDVDSGVVALLPSPGLDPEQATEILMDCVAATGKPVLASFAGLGLDPQAGPGEASRGIRPCPRTLLVDASAPDAAQRTGPEHAADAETGASAAAGRRLPGLPCYESPGVAVAALAAVVEYVEWRRREEVLLAEAKDADAEAAEELLAQWRPRVPGEGLLELEQEEASRLLACYGIAVLPSVVFRDPEQAVAAAEELGYPVVVKTVDPRMRHRLDLGGVRLDIQDEAALRRDIELMRRTLEPYGDFDLEVQSMASTGQTAVVKAMEDPLLGPVVSYGMAGDAVALLQDWAHRVPPLTAQDVRRMVRAPRASRKLFGWDGLPPVRADLLEDLLRRVAQLKDRHPEIVALELNPVLVSPERLTVLSASVSLGNPQRRTDSARRTMSA